MQLNTSLEQLLELANHYPSPHNGQPIELMTSDGSNFEVYFQKERGLQATEVSYLFSYVTMGVFIEHLSLCAKALGYDLAYNLQLPPRDALKGHGSVKFAACQLQPGRAAPDLALHETLLSRQTSRKKYFEGIDDELSQHTIDLSAKKGMQLVKMNRKGTHQAIWLNQRAVFDDMFDDAVREELNHWLRYSEREKVAKKEVNRWNKVS